MQTRTSALDYCELFAIANCPSFTFERVSENVATIPLAIDAHHQASLVEAIDTDARDSILRDHPNGGRDDWHLHPRCLPPLCQPLQR